MNFSFCLECVQSLFTDIDYADDAVLFAEDDVQWTSVLESFDTTAKIMNK